jgi:hypothetical protein
MSDQSIQRKLICEAEVGDYIHWFGVTSAIAHDKATFEETDGKRICHIAPGYCANGPNVNVRMVFEYVPDVEAYRRIG